MSFFKSSENILKKEGEQNTYSKFSHDMAQCKFSAVCKTCFTAIRFLSMKKSYYYTPRKLCLWEGILFSRCPSVCPTERKSDRASVTFCFLNILKNH